MDQGLLIGIGAALAGAVASEIIRRIAQDRDGAAKMVARGEATSLVGDLRTSVAKLNDLVQEMRRDYDVRFARNESLQREIDAIREVQHDHAEDILRLRGGVHKIANLIQGSTPGFSPYEKS